MNLIKWNIKLSSETSEAIISFILKQDNFTKAQEYITNFTKPQEDITPVPWLDQ